MLEALLVAAAVAVLVGIVLLFNTFFVVQQQTAAVVQSFGKFARVALPGLNMKTPFIEMIAGRLNLRVQQLDVKVETKTEDNVFVHVVMLAGIFVLLLVPQLERWVDGHVMSG